MNTAPAELLKEYVKSQQFTSHDKRTKVCSTEESKKGFLKSEDLL